MKRNAEFNEEGNESKKQKISETSLIKEETSLLSVVDTNILQNTFIDLVDRYQCSIYNKEDLKTALGLLLNFSLSCKLFLMISKQLLFPLILNNINIDLSYSEYLKISFIKETVEEDEFYEEKDINAIFYKSCRSGYYDLFNTLINYGANINHPQGEYDHSPLIVAIERGFTRTVKTLIKLTNMDINQQDIVGNTALIWACIHGNKYMVKILISRQDIDVNITDYNGETALSWAKQLTRRTITKMLEN